MNIDDFMYKSTRGGRKDVLALYEAILLTSGIYIRLDRNGFDVCYSRYKMLGGSKAFHYIERNGHYHNWTLKRKPIGQKDMPGGRRILVVSGGCTNILSSQIKK